jgi:uncharacterized protein (DUF305 family)
VSTKTIGIVGALAIVVGIGLIVVLGGDDEEAQASETDGAFITGMVPHHESAIEMAEMALDQAEHPEIRQLAQDIIASQSDEIETLESLHQRLFGGPVAGGDHGTLGLAAEEMGMEMDAAALEDADPFDREFIDMMVPHHQGAIRMAYVELAEGSDEETMALAQAIIDAQAAEIVEMNDWRTQWYGESSPAGGVPEEDESSIPGHEGMGH